MDSSLILTVIGSDRPGIVEQVAALVADHGGSWQESRMARLAGQFAGILRVSVATAQRAALEAALHDLQAQGLQTILVGSDRALATAPPLRRLELDLMGQDRPGIVAAISEVFATREINVVELHTEVTPGAMSGVAMFRALASLRCPPALDIDALRATLEAVAHDLMVDIELDPED